MPIDTIIEAKGVKKLFGKTPVLRGIDLLVSRGEILAIMGPSGSGKSTLLHCLAGIDSASGGTIMYNNKDIVQLDDQTRTILRRTDFGFVFQFSQLVPEITALDNVAIPLLLGGTKKATAYDKAKKWLHEVGLEGKENNLPGELSGGEEQRVSIARAMIIEPRVLFADEPTGSLDSLNSEQVMELFVDVAKKHNTTVIIVTHEATIAAYADREIIVRDGLLSGTT
jgi:putative ABC transport system ATP-binding protein